MITWAWEVRLLYIDRNNNRVAISKDIWRCSAAILTNLITGYEKWFNQKTREMNKQWSYAELLNFFGRMGAGEG